MNKYILWPLLRNCQLKVNERLTLAWLVFHSRYGATSVSWLSKKSGFDRKNVRKHLKTLAGLGYASRERGAWRPLEHQSYVFRKSESKNANEFYRKYVFRKLPVLDTTSRVAWVILYLVLKDPTKLFKRQTYGGIARMVGCSRSQAKAELNRLVDKLDGLNKQPLYRNNKCVGFTLLEKGGAKKPGSGVKTSD